MNDTPATAGPAPAAPATDASALRNVGVCAHIDAGKTTLTECILHVTGRERHVGRVDDGTAVMDWMSEERERGITITAAATRVTWGETELNLVDTPGHVDFTVEVERCMRVLDGAVLVMDASKGVEPQTETVWKQVAHRGLPAIAFANKCERPGADVLACAASMKERLGIRPLIVAYPIGGGDTEAPLSGVVDLVERKAYAASRAGERREIEVPAAVADEVDVLRAELVEALGDLDESMFAIVCEGGWPEPAEIRRSLSVLTHAREVVPLYCGAALLGHGVPMLLDGVVSMLPAPGEAAWPRLFRAGTDARFDGPIPEPLALAFKVHSKLRRGVRSDLTFLRLYSGQIAAGTRLVNGRTGASEEVTSVLRIHASDVEHIEVAHAGDVVAVAGLTGTGTGDTLGPDGFEARLEPPRVPVPVLGVLVEPIKDEERAVLREALERLAREDPSLRLAEDPASGQWVLEGMGELHLEIALNRLRVEFRVEPRVSPPRVAFRETVRAESRGRGTVDRSFGDRHAVADVAVELEPLPQASAPAEVVLEGDFPSADDAGEPVSAIAAIRSAVSVESRSGPLAGHPLSGLRVRVRAFEPGAPTSIEAAWVQAAVAALREALKIAARDGSVGGLEPLMEFVVESPVDVSSGVIGDLNSRSATMDEVIATGTDRRRITGSAPLRLLIGYSTDLRSLSRGRATFTMRARGMTPMATD